MQINTFARLRSIIKEPVFASELEQQYALKYVKVCEHHNAAIWHLGHALYWPFGILVGAVFGFDKPVIETYAMLGIPASLLSLLIYTKTKKTSLVRFSQLMLYLVCSLICFISCSIDLLDGVGHRGVAAFWIFGAFFGIGFLAFRSYVHIACIAVVLVASWFGLSRYPEPLIGFTVLSVLVLIASNAQIFAHRAFKLQAIETFRLQSQFTPKHLILASLEQDKPIQEIFAPKAREGVYICSDWRGFQDWCKGVSPETISSALREYFDALLAELNTLLPEGNFFADWIADELFVAIFTTDTCGRQTIIQRAISFAEKNLAVAESSRAKFLAPRGVDVGMSYGITIMGILGPTANMKATALGEVAGEARRLQSVGKELRNIGSKGLDSIVLSATVGKEIDPEASGFNRIKMSSEIAVKDLDALYVYVKQSSATPIDHCLEREHRAVA